MSIRTVSENTNTVKLEANKDKTQPIRQYKIAQIQDAVSFSGRATEAVSRVNEFAEKLRKIPNIFLEGTTRNSDSVEHAFLDSMKRVYLLLAKPVRETGIKLKIRRGKGAEEAKLIEKKFMQGKFYSVEQEGKEPLAYVFFTDKKQRLLNKNGATYVAYINTMNGREQYVGLEQILLRAVAESMINQGRLPYIQGNTLGVGTPAKTIASEQFHNHIGAKPVKGLGVKGLPKVGVATEEQARGIVQKLLAKGEFLFPETEQNAKKLLGMQ